MRTLLSPTFLKKRGDMVLTSPWFMVRGMRCVVPHPLTVSWYENVHMIGYNPKISFITFSVF